MNSQNTEQEAVLLSYMTLRTTVGMLGMTLPFVLWLGGYVFFDLEMRTSLSDYYYTPMRGVFVGFLFAIGTFFFAYRGHGREDGIAGLIVFVCAVCVALFPTLNCAAPTVSWTHHVHVISAATLLLTLAYFSFFLFTRTHSHKPPTRQKIMRNRVYHGCGIAILGAVIGAAIYVYFNDNCVPQGSHPVIIYFESIALIAFGISWVVKGEAILADD